mgnify:CR=1 FL=1
MKDGGLNLSHDYFQSNPGQVYRYSGSELEINPMYQSARRRQAAGYPSMRWGDPEDPPQRMAGEALQHVFKDNEKAPSMEELMEAGMRSPNEANWKGRMGKEDYNTPAKMFNELPEGFSVKRPGE